MPRKLRKSLLRYLSKIKRPTPQLQFPNPQSFSSSKSWILAGCKHPKTLSFAIDRKQADGAGNNDATDTAAAAATLSDVDRFLVENFRSLYLKEEEDIDEKKLGGEDRDSKNEGEVSPNSPVDSYGGSHRFFFSPGLSGSPPNDSQTESSENVGSSSPSLIGENQSKDLKLPNDCIAILRYSPNPSEEFQRAMQEMMDTHMKQHEKVDWEFMEELLFSLLNLNEKKSHKHILNAFVDLIVILRQKVEDAASKPRTVRSVRMVRRMM